MKQHKLAFAAAVAAALLLHAVAPQAYMTGARWTSPAVLVVLNPANADLGPDATEQALVAAMTEWNTRGDAAFEWVYNGRTDQATTGYDGRNLVLFRNAGDGSAIATTYSWWSGSSMLDSDIVFWDAPFAFFAGNAGCGGNGAYIEDVATHELGHALGLKHSAVGDATMYPSYNLCSQEMRTIAADDIAGVQALYGSSSSNNPPTVAIYTPVAGSTLTASAISFAGSAADVEDGNIGGALSWSSSIEGFLGTGTAFSRTLRAGTHDISASVTDRNGVTSSTTVTVTVTQPVVTVPTLAAKGTKVKGSRAVQLTWSGFTDATVRLYRNGSLVGSSATGSYSDVIGGKGGGTFQYKACGASTGACSNTATVTF